MKNNTQDLQQLATVPPICPPGFLTYFLNAPMSPKYRKTYSEMKRDKLYHLEGGELYHILGPKIDPKCGMVPLVQKTTLRRICLFTCTDMP